jgi:hypothetical protein
MTSKDQDAALAALLSEYGNTVSPADARILRRAEIALRRWGERCCMGVIYREEDTGIPCDESGEPVPDLERRALERIAKVCHRLGFVFYHQTDPRGASLYVGPADRLPGPIDQYYNRLTCCALAPWVVQKFLNSRKFQDRAS